MRLLALAFAGSVLCSVSAFAAKDNVVDERRPIIAHVPVTTVLRGQPAEITATITPQGGLVTQAQVHVKLALAGKPIIFPMTPATGEVYKAVVPVSLIKSIHRFWYFIHVYDSNGRVADTLWHEVRILDGANIEGGGAAAAGSSGGSHKGWWIAGGALVAGGVVAAVVANNDDDGGGHTSPPPASSPPPKKKQSSDKNDDDETPPCILTGSERVQYFGLGPFDEQTTRILVCGTCPNATIRATGSWGASDEKTNYNNPTCVDTDTSLQLFLYDPIDLPPPNSETINVYANGVLIDSIPWPDYIND